MELTQEIPLPGKSHIGSNVHVNLARQQLNATDCASLFIHSEQIQELRIKSGLMSRLHFLCQRVSMGTEERKGRCQTENGRENWKYVLSKQQPRLTPTKHLSCM